MSQHDGNDDTLRPRVMTIDAPLGATADTLSGPRVIATAQTGKVVPAPAEARAPAVQAKRRRGSTAVRLGMTGFGIAVCAWLGIDLYLWIDSAFNSSPMLGYAASAAAGLGIAGALAIIGHEMRTYLALKNVEANQQRFTVEWQTIRPADAHRAIREVIAEIPKDRDSKAAIAAFQRKLQRHHTPAQQLDILTQTVMTPLDRRAEAIVRKSTARAFGITAISPTAVTDALFFIACAVRMVREIAACYGHRPSALATAHLLKRLIFEAGKLGAVDFAGAALTQHIGGAVAERLATSAAESVYAGQRMARLGLVTMGLCRPIPFRGNELPGIMSSLIGNWLTKAGRTAADDKAIPD
jgi:putative membrane protein